MPDMWGSAMELPQDAGGLQVPLGPMEGQPPKVGLRSSSLPCVSLHSPPNPSPKPCSQWWQWRQAGPGSGRLAEVGRGAGGCPRMRSYSPKPSDAFWGTIGLGCSWLLASCFLTTWLTKPSPTAQRTMSGRERQAFGPGPLPFCLDASPGLCRPPALDAPQRTLFFSGLWCLSVRAPEGSRPQRTLDGWVLGE